MLGRTGAHHLTGRGHDFGGLEIIDRHPVLPTKPAETSAERQPGDAGGGVDTHRCSEAVGLGGGVESASVAPLSIVTRRLAGSTCACLHLRQVDDEPVVAQGITGDVVPAAADGEHETVVSRKVHRADDVRRGGAASDDRGRLSIIAFQI